MLPFFVFFFVFLFRARLRLGQAPLCPSVSTCVIYLRVTGLPLFAREPAPLYWELSEFAPRFRFTFFFFFAFSALPILAVVNLEVTRCVLGIALLSLIMQNLD